MWKLNIEDDEGQRTSLELSQPEYTIGRAPDAMVRLTERNVSRRHARLRQSGSGWTVEDCSSYNGLFVNGERIGAEPVPLKGQDVIQLGDYRIEVLDEQAVVQAEAGSPTSRPDRLVVVIGPTPGLEYPLQGDRMSIGRAEDAGVSINHASVSRLHAELVKLGTSKWEVVDSGSANGIRINGVELRQGLLEPGDALELGDVRLRFVAAGKYFRPRIDLSAQLPAIATDIPSGGGAGKIVAVVAVVVALLIGGVVMFTGSGETQPPKPAGETVVPSEAEARQLLEQAKKFQETDIETAHGMLKGIPDDSVVRESDEFIAIEDAWAQHIIKQALALMEKDPDKARNMLWEVADTRSVSQRLRREASELAEQLGPDPQGRSAPVIPAGPGDALTPRPKVDAGAGAPSPVATTATTVKPPPTAASVAKKFDESSQKAALMAKVSAGTASVTDAQMLKAICMNDGDRACRNTAVAYINQKNQP